MTEQESWFIVKTQTGHCEIIPASQLQDGKDSENSASSDRWGPFDSHAEAIARRIGLIRAGKCQPN